VSTGYRVIITGEGQLDYDDGIEATIRHCRNIALNIGSTLLRTFYYDVLPGAGEFLEPEVIDIYEHDPVRDRREKRTWSLGQPQPAFPRETGLQSDLALAEEWRIRAFYYALGQVHSMGGLGALSEGDATAFSYHFYQLGIPAQEISNDHLTSEWALWSAGRLAAIREEETLVRHVATGHGINHGKEPHIGRWASDDDDGRC
jgi:hypothetical protein